MRAREISISGAPVFTFELSLLRVSARHPRAVCMTEFVRGFAAVPGGGVSSVLRNLNREATTRGTCVLEVIGIIALRVFCGI